MKTIKKLFLLAFTIIYSFNINAQCPANGSYTVNGLTVNFYNTTYDFNSGFWDFGDGNTSSALNPIHTYANPGTYNITLNISYYSQTLYGPFLYNCSVGATITVTGPTNIYGCTDPTADNYEATANIDDGSCAYDCPTYNLTEVTPLGCPSTGNGSLQVEIISGSIPLSISYTWTSRSTTPMSSPYLPPYNYYTLPFTGAIATGLNDVLSYKVNIQNNNGCPDVEIGWIDIEARYGCTDVLASNYDAAANCDNSYCTYDIYGCTDATASNYDATANMDDGSCIYPIYGCTDALACNYDVAATNDNGTCEYLSCTTCNGDLITGLSVSDIIDDRAIINFDNMNTYDPIGNQVCRVDQIRIRYRKEGTSNWSQKNIASPTGYDTTTGICNSTQKTDKAIRNLTLGTTYQWEARIWYCDTETTGWVVGPNFTTAGECSNIGNLTAVGANPTKATFTWDDLTGSYEFVRIKMRVDSISNPQASDWFLVGGNGVNYGTYTKDKNGLVSGETYRAQARAWCDPNGGAYNSLSWTPLVTWTQPTSARVEGSSSINNLDVYPNPSRDIFNVSFTSEDIENLEVRVLNVVGEVVYTENLAQFVGEYTKSIDLTTYTKGVYFLEIITNNGVTNKKLILQ